MNTRHLHAIDICYPGPERSLHSERSKVKSPGLGYPLLSDCVRSVLLRKFRVLFQAYVQEGYQGTASCWPWPVVVSAGRKIGMLYEFNTCVIMIKSRFNAYYRPFLRRLAKSKTYFARRRKLQEVGDSVAIKLPKSELREHGLVNEDGDLVEEAEGRSYIDPDAGIIGSEVSLDGSDDEIPSSLSVGD